MPLRRRVRMAMFLRSFAVQGSWNYRTLIGGGLAFALLPALRAIHGRDPARLDAAVRRHMTVFNCHPYLTPMAIGALARMEAEGESDAVIERFKQAIRGSLGALGDRLVWAGLRPACLLLAMVIALAGAPWWLAVAAFLALYNAGHLLMRLWSFRLGASLGRSVGEELRRSPVPQLSRPLSLAGAGLVGVALPLVVAGRLGGASIPLAWSIAAVAGALLGARLGSAVHRPAVLALVGFALAGLLLNLVG